MVFYSISNQTLLHVSLEVFLKENVMLVNPQNSWINRQVTSLMLLLAATLSDAAAEPKIQQYIVDSDFKIVVAEEVSQYCGFGYASAKGSFNQAYSDYSRPISWQLVELKGSRSF